MSVRLRHLLLPALAAGLGACAAGADPGPQPLTPTEQFAVRVQERPEELSIFASPQGLSPEQAGALRAAAAQWRDAGGDPVTVSAPGGTDPALVQPTLHATVDVLVAGGVSPDQIIVRSHDPRETPGRPAVRVSFTSYQATGPQCADSWTPADATFSARTSGAFGCAVTANIAAQVANPRDLLRPRAETPADAARRQTQLGLYRQGQPTGATRSADEQNTLRSQVRQ